MPIEYLIDHTLQLVSAKGRGELTAEDIFGYQQEVWSRPDVAGYHELMDMTEVERIAEPRTEEIRELARVSARQDPPGVQSKFAIIAPQDLAFGLGRMYQTFRALQPATTKEVAVFRTAADALRFLGLVTESGDSDRA
jgi:hypothetical protein